MLNLRLRPPRTPRGSPIQLTNQEDRTVTRERKWATHSPYIMRNGARRHLFCGDRCQLVSFASRKTASCEGLSCPTFEKNTRCQTCCHKAQRCICRARCAPARVPASPAAPIGSAYGGLLWIWHWPARHCLGPPEALQLRAWAAAPTGRHVPPIVSTPPSRPPPPPPSPRGWALPPLVATRAPRAGGGELGQGRGRWRRQRPLVIHPPPAGWSCAGPAATPQVERTPAHAAPRLSWWMGGGGGGGGAAASANGPAVQIPYWQRPEGELVAGLALPAGNEPPGGAAPPLCERGVWPMAACARRGPHDSPTRTVAGQASNSATPWASASSIGPSLAKVVGLCAHVGLLRQILGRSLDQKRARLSASRHGTGGAKRGCERRSAVSPAGCAPPPRLPPTPPSLHRWGSAYRLAPPLPARARR